ncbi:MAG: PQQ-binding-like beta-propeller repeat protein [Pirellulaceae bacterium]|nr:PQQ-binding-like beta-propeller repeat protein [Pirellulaceae bacterium]
MYGRDTTHNAVSPERNPPTDWDVGKFDSKTGNWVGSRNILWSAPLGSISFGDPVVADGQVWIGTNNLSRPDYNEKNDASILAGFDVRNGRSLFQYVSPRLTQGRIHDWPTSPLSCSPLIEGDLMWFTTNRCETVCLDLAPLKRGEQQPREVWKVDMIKQFGVYPIRSSMMWFHSCSITSDQNRIFVITGNGFDYERKQVPAPEAPSLICFDKYTGKESLQDNSPGENILLGQWSSPLVIDVGGRVQVVVPQGDGWLRAFDTVTGKLIWKFDINLKTDKRSDDRRITRQHFLASPVFYQDRIYVSKGENEQYGEGPGRLVCIDPNKAGDISSQLALDSSGLLLPDSRIQIADLTKGHQVVSNPNSGLIWECVTSDVNGDGNIEFEEKFHLTMGNVAIKDDLLLVGDFAGGRVFTLSEYDTTEFVRALDEQTGNPLWTKELGSIVPQSPSMRWLTQRPPTVDGERVFAMGLLGELVCLRCSDGEQVWHRSYPTEFGGKSGIFGFSDCPIVYQDRLLCIPGGPDASIVALDKATGKTIWKCVVPEAGGTAYSNGVIASLAGKLQFVTFLEKTLVGIDLENGKLLWRNDRVATLSSHPHTPLISGNVITCIVGSPAKTEPSIYQIEIEQHDGLFSAREIYSDTPKLVFSRYTDDTIQLALKQANACLSELDFRSAAATVPAGLV